MVLVMGLCNSLLYNARIGYENTYYMRDEHACVKICSTKILKTVSEFDTERKQTKYNKNSPYASKSSPRPQRRHPPLHSAFGRGRRRRCFDAPRRVKHTADLARGAGHGEPQPVPRRKRLGERARKQRVLALLIIDKLFVSRFIEAKALKVERGPARLARPGLAELVGLVRDELIDGDAEERKGVDIVHPEC